MSKSPDFEDGNPSDWPSNFPEFKELETILGCGICFEYMSTAVVTKCSHNFCSLCIRRYLCYKQQCPICLEAALESDLRTNRIVDEIIQHFTKSRKRLLNLMKSYSVDSNFNKTCSSSIASPSELTSDQTFDSEVKSPSISTEPSKPDPFQKQTKCDAFKKLFLPLKKSSTVPIENDAAAPSPSFPSSQEELSDLTPQQTATEDSSSTVDFDPTSNSHLECHDDLGVKPPKPDFSLLLNQQTPESRGYDSRLPPSSFADDKLLSLGYDSRLPPSSFADDVLLSPLQKSLPSKRPPTGNTSSAAFNSSMSGLESSATVKCPVCSIHVPSKNINLHLDRCLLAEERKTKPSSSQPTRRKPLPKLVYTLLSEKELRKKLSEHGLPTNGNRQVLVKRHHEFTLMYNAQCDSLNPKSVEEIVSEIIQHDTAKSRTTALPTQSMPLKVDKQSSEEQVEMAQKQYVKQHKTQFSQLIAAAAKQNGKMNRPPPKMADLDDLKESAACADRDADSDDFFGFSPARSKASTTSFSSFYPSTSSEAASYRDPVILDSSSDTVEGHSSSDAAADGGEEAVNDQAVSNDFMAPLSVSAVIANAGNGLKFDSCSADSNSSSTPNSDECNPVRSSRRVRRRLEPVTGCGAEQSSATPGKDVLRSPVLTRQKSRRSAVKTTVQEEDSLSSDDKEISDHSEIEKNDDDDDDDYEITPSFSGRKRKNLSQLKGHQPRMKRDKGIAKKKYL